MKAYALGGKTVQLDLEQYDAERLQQVENWIEWHGADEDALTLIQAIRLAQELNEIRDSMGLPKSP